MFEIETHTRSRVVLQISTCGHEMRRDGLAVKLQDLGQQKTRRNISGPVGFATAWLVWNMPLVEFVTDLRVTR
ncbi:hypothetical protein [Bradyrhizobium sp. STM 3843]|uniref:hypothetical protein n=1 Tax=Bradyrhizobium sp. STM 3843 TaxID=551947 RepID=UPI0011126149|nr:hypothetical protein [Bradyrhizobium sp. STM 3843]